MSTLKRCDACHEIWDPADHTNEYSASAQDTNRCSVSVVAPTANNNYRRQAYNKALEVCQDCAREVITLLEGKSSKNA